MERLIEKLKRIQALAESGVEGEQDNARRLLKQLCDKHHVTLDQLQSTETFPVELKCANAMERFLLIQCALWICGTRQITHIPRQRSICFHLTAAQAVDLRECYQHYRPLWKRLLNDHESDLMAAFIHKHRLYLPKEMDSTEEKNPRATGERPRHRRPHPQPHEAHAQHPLAKTPQTHRMKHTPT